MHICAAGRGDDRRNGAGRAAGQISFRRPRRLGGRSRARLRHILPADRHGCVPCAGIVRIHRRSGFDPDRYGTVHPFGDRRSGVLCRLGALENGGGGRADIVHGVRGVRSCSVCAACVFRAGILYFALRKERRTRGAALSCARSRTAGGYLVQPDARHGLGPAGRAAVAGGCGFCAAGRPGMDAADLCKIRDLRLRCCGDRRGRAAVFVGAAAARFVPLFRAGALAFGLGRFSFV